MISARQQNSCQVSQNPLASISSAEVFLKKFKGKKRFTILVYASIPKVRSLQNIENFISSTLISQVA
jgi:hypothetical protein